MAQLHNKIFLPSDGVLIIMIKILPFFFTIKILLLSFVTCIISSSSEKQHSGDGLMIGRDDFRGPF